MHQAFYRKYRPQVFDDVCGQEHITSVLKYEAEQGRVSHAYLFCGSRGTGKTTCAKILAKAVNCEDLQNGDPCGKCSACRAIDSGSATDVVEMDAASNNGVDNIRELRDEVVYTPSMLRKRVYIIDEVHMLSVSAFNALLKTLEEPPEYVVFILATTELHKLPATIVSRCQRFDFRRITVNDICDRLEYIAGRENITLERTAAERIARIAEGGMRDAVNLFELCAGGGAKVDVDRVTSVLGLSGYDAMKRAAKAASSADAETLISMIAQTQASSKDLIVLWQELTSFWRDMMIMKVSGDPARYLDLTDAEFAVLHECASMFNVNKLLYQSSILDAAQKDMARSPQNKRTIAEFAVLRLTVPALDTSVDALMSRIAELEDKVALLESGVVAAPRAPFEASDVPASSENRKPSAERQSEPAVKEEAFPVGEAVGASDHSEGFVPIPDVQSLIEKLGPGADMYKTFLEEAVVEMNGDCTVMQITVSDSFAMSMLDSEAVKSNIARASVLAKLSSGLPGVTVVKAAPSKDVNQTDIFGNFDF